MTDEAKDGPDTSDVLVFADETAEGPRAGADPWKVLVVDDDPDVFAVTEIVLSDIRLDGHGIITRQARSAAEAFEMLQSEGDIAAILLDVIMETPDAGLRLVRQVREDLGNDHVRIILRTGQPGQVPERRVFLTYDINDYLSKIDLTEDRLFTAVIGALRSYRQITALDAARTRAELLDRKLAQSQKMEALGTLAGGIAHDFNNILATVIGASEVALDALAEDHPARPYVRNSFDAGLRGKDLVRRILTFSRPAQHAFRPIDLRPVVEDGLTLLRATLPASVVLEVGLPDRPLPVVGDPVQIQQVLTNLCTNAIQAMPEGGAITVTLVRAPDGAAELSVRDTGCGMDPGIRDSIFDPFFTTKEAGAGTGLGLSVVHGIVAAHDGAIAVDTAAGEGTRVAVTLPTTDADPEAPGGLAPVGAVPLGDGQRVLLVDDEAALIDIGLETLVKLGYDAEGFVDPRKALAAVAADPGRYAVVVTDHRMAGLDGVRLAEALRQEAPDLPILLVTGNANAVDRPAVAAVGISRILEKPLMTEDLAAALAAVLAP